MLYLLTPTSDLLTQGSMGTSGEGATLPTSMQNPLDLGDLGPTSHG